MKIVGKKMNIEQFEKYVQKLNFKPNDPDKVILHHTWQPNLASWKGKDSVWGLKKYYESKGWSAGPHLFIDSEGIWLFTPMNKQGIHAGRGNFRSIGIEMVGNYTYSKPQGDIWRNTLAAINSLRDKLGIEDANIKFHRDYAVKSSGCPGWSITKKWLLQELERTAIPQWAKAGVKFCRQNKIIDQFEGIEDYRDAVKLHRLYKLITNK